MQPQPAAQSAGAEYQHQPKAVGNERPNEPESKCANVAEFKRQEPREAASIRMLNAQLHAFAAEAVAADQRAAALAGETGSLRDELARRENENASLQTSLNLVVIENSQLSSRLAETDAALARVQSQLDLANASLAQALAERDRLAAVVAAHRQIALAPTRSKPISKPRVPAPSPRKRCWPRRGRV